MLDGLLGIQGLRKEGLFDKEKGVEINGVPTLFIRHLTLPRNSCRAWTAYSHTAENSKYVPGYCCQSTLSYQAHSCPSHCSSLASLYHRDGLPGVCSREKRLDVYVSEYQMLPAVDLSDDGGNITSGKLGQL